MRGYNMTSANMTYYRIFDLSGKLIFTHSQHHYCKNTIKAELQKYVPAENYMIQCNTPDEDECDNYSKKVNLKDYLDGKYKRTLWDEQNEDKTDADYCDKHGYKHLKENCVECLQERLNDIINNATEINLKDSSECPFRSDLGSCKIRSSKAELRDINGCRDADNNNFIFPDGCPVVKGIVVNINNS